MLPLSFVWNWLALQSKVYQEKQNNLHLYLPNTILTNKMISKALVSYTTFSHIFVISAIGTHPPVTKNGPWTPGGFWVELPCPLPLGTSACGGWAREVVGHTYLHQWPFLWIIFKLWKLLFCGYCYRTCHLCVYPSWKFRITVLSDSLWFLPHTCELRLYPAALTITPVIKILP